MATVRLLTLRLLSVSALLTSLMLFSCPLLAQDAAASEVTGEASVVIVEDFASGRSELHHYIRDLTRNKEIRLHFARGAPREFVTGKTFKVRGRGRPDQGLDVDSLTAMADGDVTGGESTSAAPVAAAETRKVLTLLVDFNDALVDNGSSRGISLQEAKDRMFNETRNVQDFYEKASLGTLHIADDPDGDGSQDVFGPYKIDFDYMNSTCAYTSWVTAARQAWEAANPGRSYTEYRHTLLIVPNYWDYPGSAGRSCTWGGIANLGCGSTCYALVADPLSILHGVIIHELGHNFTMHHASTDPNNDGTIDSEYGDYSDNMGGDRIWAKFNAVHAAEMGWHDPLNYEIQTVVPASGTVHEFDLLALDEEAAEWPGLRAVKVARDSGSDYYLSYRLAEGPYSEMSASYAGRLNIHYGRDINRSYLVTTLLPGQSYTDPHNGLIFEAVAETTVDATRVLTARLCKDSCASIPAPANLAALAGGRTSVQLTWDYDDPAATFVLQHSTDGETWTDETGYTGSDRFFTDAGLTPGSTHHYRVQASLGEQVSGWSNTATAVTDADPPVASFTWSADFTNVTFSDASIDGDGTVNAWRWSFGDGTTSTAQNPVHEFSTGGSYNVGLTVTDDNGQQDSISREVTVVESPFAYFVAQGESTAGGTVSGSYLDTRASDGSVEALTERDSGGKPSKRYSWLEHQWDFNVQMGLSATLHWRAWFDANADGDRFAFQYAIDGGDWMPLFTLEATADPGNQSLALPGGFGGAVSIRVVDTDQTAGNRSLDTVYIDILMIEVEKGTPAGPDAPSALSATAQGHDAIALSWIDHASDESGFRIQRQDGANWIQVGTTGPDETTFTDNGLAGSTTYVYRVLAFNMVGVSDASNTASATTAEPPPQPDLALTVEAVKVRAIHMPLLTWTPAGDMDVWFDQAAPVQIATAVASGYTHDTGNKKGGPYTYQVCPTDGAGACSDWVEVAY